MTHTDTLMLRMNRAYFVVEFLQSLKLHPSIVWDRSRLLQELEDTFQNTPRLEWHGLFSTKQLWASLEFDEVVVGLSKGFEIGYDEFSERYGVNGETIGNSLLKVDGGIIFTNMDQLVNDDWFRRLQDMATRLGYTSTNQRLWAK